MKSEYEIKVTGTSANWSFGTIRKPGGGEILCFQMKHFDEPSQYGIDAGRISKLCVRRDGESKDLIAYERGWLVKPRTAAHRAVLAALKERFN